MSVQFENLDPAELTDRYELVLTNGVNPKLFCELYVPKGWKDILCLFLDHLQQAHRYELDHPSAIQSSQVPRIIQIKEKWGLLDVNFEHNTTTSPESYQYYAGMAYMLYLISGSTCQICGQSGATSTRAANTNWTVTLCGSCQQAQQEEKICP